jgi:hypothetical protein
MFRKLKIDVINDLLNKVNDPKQKIELHRILKRVRVETVKKCWFVNEDWSVYAAHRFVYKTLVGNLIHGHVICHTCDRKGCVNPEHLVQGTQSHNMRDARKKGRVKDLVINHANGNR